MEMLVLLDFEATMPDELTVRMGEVVQNATNIDEDGWLMGELQGRRGIFPSNFVKEIPVYLIGNSQREPRSIRKTKKGLERKCEVAFAYSPENGDELELVAGETLEIIKEIEDGWWMGRKNGKVGAFPSNFVKEIFVSPKDLNEPKVRPKLSEAVFSNKNTQRVSVRNKAKNRVEYCQVMFDFKAKAPDELELKKGDVVTIRNKETEDEGWWEGELNGRCGFFPDNFVMVLPPKDSLQSESTCQPPARGNSIKLPAKKEVTVMEKNDHAKTKDGKPEHIDFRSYPPTKVKLPLIKPSPPPIKEKPSKLIPTTANGDEAPIAPKQPEEKPADQFDGIAVQTEKLSHPTANRAKPPQRRPPTGTSVAQTPNEKDQTDAEPSPKMTKHDKLPGFPKPSENNQTFPAKPEIPAKVQLPVRPGFPKAVVGKPVNQNDQEPTVASLQAEIKELRMALELLQTRQQQDMQEVKEELKEERNKRLALQEEVKNLKAKH